MLAACGAAAGSGEASSAANGSITVFAAASLRAAFSKIGYDFEKRNPGTRVQFSFGGSPTLAMQIQQGAGADVFASADQANMQKLVAGGMVDGRPAIFARNRLEIVVAPGNPKHITGLADLARPGLIVVFCAPEVPCGRYGNQALQKAGVSVKPASLEVDVKSVVSKVSLGEADAGIAYVTDVKAASSIQGVALPAAQNVIADYPIAVLHDSPNVKLAKAFESYVLRNDGEGDKGGQLILRQYGFLGP
jgi:molybdate transport system substrate-binding protein